MQVRYYRLPEEPSKFVEDLHNASVQNEVITPEEQQQKEEEIRQQLEAQKNHERIQRIKDQAKEIAKDEAKKYAKKELKRAGAKVVERVAARGIWAILVETFPIWGPIAGGLIVIAILFMIVISIPALLAHECQSNTLIGNSLSFGSRVAKFIGWEEYAICDGFNLGQRLSAQQPIPSQSNGQPADLVKISGVPTTASSPFLRPCMMGLVQIIYNEAQAKGIDFYISSAYRPGAVVRETGKVSAHARGEAVDMIIRPPGAMSIQQLQTALSDKNFLKKIDTLVAISEAQGFIKIQGDTLDEYRRPTEGATGGHIHIEFNVPQNGGSYCDNYG